MADGRVCVFLLILLLLMAGDIEKCPGPWKEQDFTIVHQNIRGLSSKLELLTYFIKNHNIKIFGVTETLLNDSLPTSFINISGYTFERRDRVSQGGGVGAYISNSLNYVRRLDLETYDIECIWLEIFSDYTKSFIVGILYRPPNTSKHLSKNFNNNFQKTLTKINNGNKELIILGDINCNYLIKNNNKPLKDLLSLNGLIQTIKGPTRITDTTESLIDVILTTKPENLMEIKIVSTALSDHYAIGCKRKLNNIKQQYESIKCRDYSNYNSSELSRDLSNENWDSVYAERNPNNAWDTLRDIVSRNFNKHAPNITKKVKGKKSPWLTRDIKLEMNYRDTLNRKFRKSRTSTDFEKFKSQRNKVNNLVRKARNEHSRTLLQETANDPKRFWKTLKRIFPLKEKISTVKSFIIDGIRNSNAKSIASRFCSYFSTTVSKLKAKAMPLKNFIWAKPKESNLKTSTTFEFTEVTVNEVFMHLKKLKRSKACGSDDLPPGMLKDSAKHLAKPLCHVINASLRSGIIPSDFKLGQVTPIHKSGRKDDMDNYRPITVLPVCSKILEKCIHNQLCKFLEQNKLLSETQFGFRKKRNTELAATLFLDTIRRNIDNGELTGAIFIDLSKAFDSLSHAQIIESLKSHGVTGIEKELFTDYLFGRKQTVKINNETSEPESVTCGVPQGSILGPLLFLITFNDIGSVLSNCKILTYADDTVIYVSGKTKDSIEKLLTDDFNRVADWLEMNDLVINMKKGKTECMLFGTTQRIKNKTLDIDYRHQSLSFTNSYKYLGVKLNQTLSLCEHIESTYKKVRGRLYLLQRIRPQLTIETASTIYKTMLIPVFTYCSIITCYSTKTYQLKLENLEKRANRIIFKKNVPRKSKPASIKDLLRKRLCLQVFKCVHGDVCETFVNYFEKMTNNTRNKNHLLRLPKIKLESSRKSFFFNGAKTFNELPLKIRASTSIEDFVKLYEEFF